MTEYLKGVLLIALTWTINPLLEVIVDPIEFGKFDTYLIYIREIVSTLTTIVILITVIVKYLKERNKK